MSLIHRIKASFRALFPRRYAWPGMDIALPGGQQLHLVGSIHMGTRDMQPLPAGLLRQLQKADALVVEADITRGSSPFSEGEAYPPLATRLTPETLQQLTALCDELSLNIALFDSRRDPWEILERCHAPLPDCGADYTVALALAMSEVPA